MSDKLRDLKYVEAVKRGKETFERLTIEGREKFEDLLATPGDDIVTTMTTALNVESKKRIAAESALTELAQLVKTEMEQELEATARRNDTALESTRKTYEQECRRLAEHRDTISRERDEIATAKADSDKKISDLNAIIHNLRQDLETVRRDADQRIEASKKCHHTKLVDALIETNEGWWQFLLKRAMDEPRVCAQVKKILHELAVVKTIENR